MLRHGQSFQRNTAFAACRNPYWRKQPPSRQRGRYPRHETHRDAGRTNLPVYESRALFAGTNEVGIVHEGALYRLKTTGQGKLVLNT
ncbi:MAG: hemin uptake protein HemP [Salaquimonas sp.]|nr:hemin uptake protein HemP [Salaquimonas sp.]